MSEQWSKIFVFARVASATLVALIPSAQKIAPFDLITRQASGDTTKHFVFDEDSQEYYWDDKPLNPKRH